jgi:hypothetical protein
VIVRRVRFTSTARGHLREAKKWWRENRADQDTLAEDVEDALFDNEVVIRAFWHASRGTGPHLVR